MGYIFLNPQVMTLIILFVQIDEIFKTKAVTDSDTDSDTESEPTDSLTVHYVSHLGSIVYGLTVNGKDYGFKSENSANISPCPNSTCCKFKRLTYKYHACSTFTGEPI